MRAAAFAAIFGLIFIWAPAAAQNAPARDKHAEIDEFISGMKGYTFNPNPSAAEERRVRGLLELGRSSIISVPDVDYFNTSIARQTDGSPLAIIEKLVNLSSLSTPEIRVNATRILADVTENRSVCVVLDRLIETDVLPTTRFNLFQVVKIVSLRLKYTEVAEWIQETIDANYNFQTIDPIGENVQRVDKTSGLLREISRTVRSKRGEVSASLSRDEPRFYASCVALKNLKSSANPPT